MFNTVERIKEPKRMMGQKRGGNIPLLNALRGLAAIGVWLTHSGTTAFPMRSGAVFVDIFMAISGFLMCHNYIRREEREPWERGSTILIFYLSRFFRIAPVYYVCLLFFYVFLWNKDIGGGVSLAWNIIQHITFIFGIYQSSPATMMPDWSIALEMQFYLFFPFLMLLARRIGIVWLVVCSFAVCWLFKQVYGVYGVPGPWGSYLQPTILPLKFTLFTFGMLAAYVYHERVKAGWLVYICLAILCALPFHHGHSWGVLGLLGIGLALNAQYWFKFMTTKLNDFCDKRVFTWVADISYGLYLMHGFVFFFLHEKMRDTGMTHGAWVNWALILAVSAFILAPLTSLLYYLLEKPCILLGRKLVHRS
jgi:peptidoglycan/LPS O-acetylase OafA/YrhL